MNSFIMELLDALVVTLGGLVRTPISMEVDFLALWRPCISLA